MNVTTMNNPTIQAINSKPIDKAVASPANIAAKTNDQSVVTQQTEISNEGVVASYLANLSPQQQEEMEAFLTQVHQQKTDGSFDAKVATKQAPNSMNELSSMLNVSTEDLLNHIPAKSAPDNQATNPAELNSPAIKTYMAVAQ